MKRLLMAVCTLALVAGAESFARADYVQTCQQCQTQRPHHHGHHGQRQAQACPPQKCSPFASLMNCLGLGSGGQQQQMAGPPMQGPTVAYPYYTTRAPRDFLDPNPRSIGP